MLLIISVIKRFYTKCPFDKAVRPRDDASRKRSDPAPPTGARERRPREGTRTKRKR
ncbi:MAG: hypothetical protein F6K23_20280 [Okeania sp. SIO2C9]|uniref:hypothetical protein n=1 Tax=Okeania sp. SIO2C9 TaxID=2607791 RepID=UPI0013C0B846|nr:hypothetical protein [Okeania sp. SIO2C9]NEQ75178.1 hypothetical protein [Okeania sp. SIO2C9]